jgi:drug/metabolite transporter (DMT)-like permease
MKYYIFAILFAVFTATVGVFTKLIGGRVPVMTLVFTRFLISTVFVGLLAPLIDKTTFKLKKNDLKDYIIISLLYVINFSLFLPANLLAPIQNVELINYSYVFIVFILAYFFLGEKITKKKIISAVVALIGLAIINPFQYGEYFWGNLLAFICAITFAILLVRLRKIDMSHGIGDVFWFFLFATILSLPFPIIFGFGEIKSVKLLVLGLGIIATGLTYFFSNLALEGIEVEMLSLVALILTPLTAITLAYFLLGEGINIRTIIGGSLLVSAGVYLQWHKKKLKS